AQSRPKEKILDLSGLFSERAALPRALFAQAERFDQLAIAIEALALEVLEQRTALADHLEQAAAAVVVLVVELAVLGEVQDALGQKGDLHFRGAGVALVLPKLRDRLGLAYGGNRHGNSSRRRPRPGWNVCRGRAQIGGNHAERQALGATWRTPCASSGNTRS